MSRHMKIFCSSAAAFLLLGLSAGPAAAQAKPLKCECKNLNKCVLEKGRIDVPFTYDPNNPAAYDRAEQKAMRDADQQAADAAAAAVAKYGGLMCPTPCGPAEIWSKHGRPFAGASGGRGEGRSIWKVSYMCTKAPPEEEESGGGPDFNINLGIGFGIVGGHYYDRDRGRHHWRDRDRDDDRDGDRRGCGDRHGKSGGEKGKDKEKDKSKYKGKGCGPY